MQITFVDTVESWKQMLPLSYTRPVAEMRVGILKIHEKWMKHFDIDQVFFQSKDYLSPLFAKPKEKGLCILGNILPTPELVQSIKSLNEDETIIDGNTIIAGFFESNEPFEIGDRKPIIIKNLRKIIHPWDIFCYNGEEIESDYRLLTNKKNSQPLYDKHTKTYGNRLFLEEGISVKAAIFNTETGPIYIGKEVQIEEGAIIRGPVALCHHSVVTMGAKIKENTTVGPYSKVGGELSNSVLFGYSNKGHEGFLGNSVLGEWCNLGANTNSSNLKNNYTNVKMWDFETNQFKNTGLQFCGLIMGDHSKCGINTMFNTGTTVGVSANIFGGGVPAKIIPSFAWGGSSDFTTYQIKKALETMNLVMKRRNKDFKKSDKIVLSHIFKMTAENRVWEKT